MRYVSIPFLQVVTLVAFGRCFGALIATIVGFTMKTLKKKSFKLIKKLVLRKKFVFSNHKRNVFLWFEEIFWSKIFFFLKPT